MFLRNYDNYWVAMQCFNKQVNSFGYKEYGAAVYGNTQEFKDGFINQKTTDSTVKQVVLGHYKQIQPPYNFSVSGICFGNGESPVSYEDYRLSGDVVPNKLVVEKTTTSYSADRKKYIKRIVGSYYNNTSNTIIISEWGLFRQNYSTTEPNYAYSNASSYVVLVFRELLSEHISIPPGETATITLTLEIPTLNN